MEIEAIAKELKAHELKDDLREEKLTKQLNKEATKMGQPVNVFTTPTDGGGSGLPLAAMAMAGNHGLGGAGAGLGAGLVGGLLGGLLFGGRGIGGLGGVAAVDGVAGCNRPQSADMATTQAMGLMTSIGGVKDNVSMGNQMLTNAVSGGFAAQAQMTLQQTIMQIQQANTNQAMTMAELCGINQNISAQGCMTRESVMADGAATRGLITAQYEASLNRKLVERENKITELENEGRHRDLASRIEITNTAVAAQAQGQQQQQQQQLVATVNSLFPLLQGVLQVAHATNSNVIAGNSGTVTTGTQTANPVNVNT
jgi:hypothetical protein